MAGGAVAAEPVPGAPGIGDPLLPELGNGGYDALHHVLHLRYAAAQGPVEGRVTMRAEALQDLTRFNLDFDDGPVTEVVVDGREAEWSARAPRPAPGGRRRDLPADRAHLGAAVPQRGRGDGRRHPPRLAVAGRDLAPFLEAWVYGMRTPPMPGLPDWVVTPVEAPVAQAFARPGPTVRR